MVALAYRGEKLLAHWDRCVHCTRHRSAINGGRIRRTTMFKASAGVMLPTSIIGSLPRPTWYTATLGSTPFLEAMVNSRYREQYEDAVSCYLREQEIAGLDIFTDGDAHFDERSAA